MVIHNLMTTVHKITNKIEANSGQSNYKGNIKKSMTEHRIQTFKIRDKAKIIMDIDTTHNEN
jgi:hypothetical protein